MSSTGKTRRFDERLPQIRSAAAGINVGGSEIWVDVGSRDPEPVRKFATFTADLHELADWLKHCGIDTVAMESTGVYWIPVCQILESKGIEVVLVNARHAKNVTGRKTDMLDCQWLRTLHSYAASFRPARDIGVLRCYVRHRQMLIEYASAHVQHMQKALTQMNLKLQYVLSDITGATGMRIIRAIVAGERDRNRLAAMRAVRTKADEAAITKALDKDDQMEHLLALKQSLKFYDSYQQQIETYHRQIAEHLQSLESKADPSELKPARIRRKKPRNRPKFDLREEAFRISGVDLTQIDGINETSALGLIAEIGLDMSPWRTEKHFVSWLALCPNNKISGEKLLSRPTRKSANRARTILKMSAQGLLHSQSALGAFCRRMCGRLGIPKGITAVAHKLALLVYRMIKLGRQYIDIGQERYEQKYRDRLLKHLARKANAFGFQLVPSTSK